MHTIINVDDYDPGRYARTKVLAQAGFDVKEAATGREALRLASELKPELVLLDVNLPDMNGMEVCRRLKNNPVTSGIVVLHLTASSISPSNMVEGLNGGADSYLTEPIEPAVLVATIHALLRARQAEEALRRSNDELQQFAYMVSHELNEPLRMVAAYTQLLAKRYAGKLDRQADDYIAITVSAATRMQSFVQDVLNFSSAGAPTRVIEPVSAEAVLAAALFELQLIVSESGAIVTHDPLPTIHGDQASLVRLFANLIGNSIKYRRAETPRIYISAGEQSGFWRFEFRDNGIGIDPQYWDRIFTVFKRLHGSEYPGNGVGLALCRRVVENHGGTIWLESAPGEGSTFYFTIPQLPAGVTTRIPTVQ
ncbi:MAG TPA: ATP-binding protein [Bryobacteraceae bacterium]|nr:ATP-binding protein [Bryobacteraceae bacterium]